MRLRLRKRKREIELLFVSIFGWKLIWFLFCSKNDDHFDEKICSDFFGIFNWLCFDLFGIFYSLHHQWHCPLLILPASSYRQFSHRTATSTKTHTKCTATANTGMISPSLQTSQIQHINCLGTLCYCFTTRYLFWHLAHFFLWVFQFSFLIAKCLCLFSVFFFNLNFFSKIIAYL